MSSKIEIEPLTANFLAPTTITPSYNYSLGMSESLTTSQKFEQEGTPKEFLKKVGLAVQLNCNRMNDLQFDRTIECERSLRL